MADTTVTVPPQAVSRAASEGSAALPAETLVTTHRIFESSVGRRECLDLLHGDIFDSRPHVALSALQAVASLGEQRSFPYVSRLLTGSQGEVQRAAARALGKLCHPGGGKLLLDIAKTTRDEALRREALEGLAAAPSPGRESLAFIGQLARSPVGSPAARAHAAGLFLRAGGVPALEQLLADGGGELLGEVVKAAAASPDLVPRALAASAPLWARLVPQTRVSLVSLAARWPLAESPGILGAALADSHPEVRRAAYAALGTEAHQAGWMSEVVSKLSQFVEASPAIEDEVHLAIARMEKLPGARAAVQPEVRARVMALVEELSKKLGTEGRRMASDSHELGWIITRSREYLEFYGEEEFKGSLLRWLKGLSADSEDGMLRLLKATAVRVEVRHFDGYSALADLIRNPKRSGVALVARELALAKTGKARVFWHLVRAIRLSSLFLVSSPGGSAASLLSGIFAWARRERLYRLAEAALTALARVDIPSALAACRECLALPLASKVLAIASLHLLRDLNAAELEPAAAALLASQDDPYVTMNALEAVSAGPPSQSAELARALLCRLALPASREVRDAVVAFLGERMSLDITESLKDAALGPDEGRRASALAVLDRRIGAGLVANRDGTVEFLYRILRGEQQVSRRSAALMLWKLGDEYALEVLRDFLSSGGDGTTLELLRRLRGWLRPELVPALEPLAAAGSPDVHAALRDLLAASAAGSPVDAEALRAAVGDFALRLRGGALEEEEEETPAAAATLQSERSAYRFERENLQALVMFFSDIVGYSRKAQSLSPMQLSGLLQEYEEILLTHVEAHRGELVKRMGDGHMIVFREPLHAVLAAIRLQKALRRFNRYRDENTRVVIRIGIHGGKVVRKPGGDVLGNAVNIAARLETAASPGSILVSEEVHSAVRDFVHAREIGRISVKNIAEPVRVFEPYEIVLDLPAAVDPSRSPAASSVSAKGGPPVGPRAAAKPAAVELDGDVYAEIVRGFAQLTGLCRAAGGGQVSVAAIHQEVLARWNRLGPRLPPAGRER
jgi:class 3 adenylate cyclase